MQRPRLEQTSMIWNTFSSRVASRPAPVTIKIKASQPAIHSAALGLEGVRFISGECQSGETRVRDPVSAATENFATRKYADAVMRGSRNRCYGGAPGCT